MRCRAPQGRWCPGATVGLPSSSAPIFVILRLVRKIVSQFVRERTQVVPKLPKGCSAMPSQRIADLAEGPTLSPATGKQQLLRQSCSTTNKTVDLNHNKYYMHGLCRVGFSEARLGWLLRRAYA